MIELSNLKLIKNIYCCGLTTNADPHLGHARTFLVAITIKKVISLLSDSSPRLIVNWTDVDPKIGFLTKEQYLNLSKKSISLAKTKLSPIINWSKIDDEPKVSSYISEIIADIVQLEKLGYTYLDSRGVRLKDLHHTLLGFQGKEGFYLWRLTSNVGYQSPWGLGIPGWHLECSTMISKITGKVDLHMGGADLCFPHHLNEDLIHTLLHDTGVAKRWLHVGLLNVEGIKMSKSLENVITLDNFSADWLTLLSIKIYLLWSHVEKPLSFSKKELLRIRNLCSKMILEKELNLELQHSLIEEWVSKPSIREIIMVSSLPTKTLLNLSVKLGIISKEELYLVRNIIKRVQLLRLRLRVRKDFQLADSLREIIKLTYGFSLTDDKLVILG